MSHRIGPQVGDAAQAGSEWVAIIDFGSQYAQLIGRRVREARVFSEIIPYDAPLEPVLARRPRGIILTGAPASVHDEGAPEVDPAVFEAGIPVLGIGYGMQYMARVLGGQVERSPQREYGPARLQVLEPGSLFQSIVQGAGTSGSPDSGGGPDAGADGSGSQLSCWMSTADRVTQPPPGFQVLARTDHTPVAAMGDPQRGLYGVQFHPEVAHTPWGQKLLENFLFEVCRCQGTWTMRSFIDQAVEDIRRLVGDQRVVCALSGGVDSAVAATLVHRAIGRQLISIFVDHGFMRKDEGRQVVATFRDQLGMNLVHVEAQERFLARLKGITDPEEKRKRIGREFIAVFEEEAGRLGDIQYLVQGTLYSDVIESGPGKAAVIKSHHNVGGLPERMNLKLLEPLRQLFKDEVRELGRELGLPEDIVGRQPFPGPGLAIRIMGEVTPEKLAIAREANFIVVDEIRKAGLDREVWQGFAVLTNTRSVGVMGDQRTYGYVVAVRAVTSTDGMTADWVRLPWDVLARISSRIMNEVEGVSRVVYDISSKPPSTIEWE